MVVLVDVVLVDVVLVDVVVEPMMMMISTGPRSTPITNRSGREWGSGAPPTAA